MVQHGASMARYESGVTVVVSGGLFDRDQERAPTIYVPILLRNDSAEPQMVVKVELLVGALKLQTHEPPSSSSDGWLTRIHWFRARDVVIEAQQEVGGDVEFLCSTRFPDPPIKGTLRVTLGNETVVTREVQIVDSPRDWRNWRDWMEDGEQAEAGGDSDQPVKQGPNRLSRKGEQWTVEYGGVEKTLRPLKGLEYLAELLRCPHHVQSAAQLSGASAVCSEGKAVDQNLDDGDVKDKTERNRLVGVDDVFDDETERMLGERLDLLRGRKEDLEANNSPLPTSLVSEIEKVAAQLARIRQDNRKGRMQQFTTNKKRARQAVSSAVKRAIKAIAKVHPDLGSHLKLEVKLGNTLLYDPNPPTTWLVSFD